VRERLDAPGGAAVPPSGPQGADKRGRGAELGRALLGELLVLVVCAVFWWQTYAFEQPDAQGLGPAFVPRLLIGLLVVCVLVRVVQSVLEVRRPDAHRHSGTPHVEEGELAEEEYPASTPHVLLGIGLAAGYVLATTLVGYPIATFLLVVAFVWTASRLSWTVVAVALGVALAFPYLFVRVVFIDLPRGIGVFDDFTIWLYSLLGIY
jgi:hypothetical protein